MLEEFINKQFGGNREEAIKCIAEELSMLDYKKTTDLETCRKYVNELTPDEKKRAHNYFIYNLKAKQNIEKKLSSLNLSYEEVKNSRIDTDKFRKFLVSDVLAILLINARSLFTGVAPWYDLLSILVTSASLVLIFKQLLKFYKSKKVMEYADNEAELTEYLSQITNEQNIEDLEKKGKLL